MRLNQTVMRFMKGDFIKAIQFVPLEVSLTRLDTMIAGIGERRRKAAGVSFKDAAHVEPHWNGTAFVSASPSVPLEVSLERLDSIIADIAKARVQAARNDPNALRV